jgi:hypothetical protein
MSAIIASQSSALSAEMLDSRAAKIGMHFAGMTKLLVRSFNDERWDEPVAASRIRLNVAARENLGHWPGIF